jgi:hypothetical protein
MQALRILDIHPLDVAVELLLRTLLVVALAGDANAYSERDALNAGLPDFLVELRVDADVLGALPRLVRWMASRKSR